MTNKSKLEKRGEELAAALTNKDKRAAVQYFDTAYEDMDQFDQLVLFAYVAENRAHSLEHYDGLPMGDLVKVIEGE